MAKKKNDVGKVANMLAIEHRRVAAEKGAANCALEGITTDNENEKALVERWVSGEITDADFIGAPVIY